MLKRIIFHLFCWFVAGTIFSFVFMPFDRSPWENTFIQMTLYMSVFAVPFYGHFYILIPKFFIRKRFFAYFVLILLTFLITTAYSYLTIQIGANIFHLQSYKNLVFTFLQLFINVTLWSVLAVIMSGAGWFYLNWHRSEKEKAILKAEQLKAELLYLRSQINPHFLFNTLNNIYSLSQKGSAETSEAILKLSGLLRYFLYKTDESEIPLSEEIFYIEEYLYLQKIRLKETCKIDLAISGKIDNFLIPPLLLFPLVENVFKHGDVKPSSNFLSIRLTVNDNLLSFYIKNKINKEVYHKEGGIGISNLRKRLKLLFENRHSLKIESDNENFVVMLKLQNK